MNFDEALQRVLKHEGGYINHPSDPGGETNYGITVAVARQHGYTGPMRSISMFVVSEIYRKSYWDKLRCEELPPAMRFPAFDAAVNSGVTMSAKWLQRALGVPEDGLIGPKTIAAANRADPAHIAAKLTGYRLAMLAGLKHFDQFGRGWTRRIASVLMEA